MDDLVGRTLGQYRIVEQLGEGGMATVYKAFQPSLNRYVAIKVLPPYLARQQPDFAARFTREAHAVAQLQHPNILGIYDFGQEGDLSYIVMQYVEAGTLEERMRRPMDLETVAKVIEQLADALDYAHQRDIVHRDVKPTNVLMEDGRWPLLADFGIAKMLGGNTGLTATGVGIGTPAYMPPEQGQGKPVDARSDVYSLGVVLFEMLTGRVPFVADTPVGMVMQHVLGPLPPPRSLNPDIPEAVEQVVFKALAKAPDDRFASAGEMAAALKQAVVAGIAPQFAPPIVKAAPAPPPVVARPERRIAWGKVLGKVVRETLGMIFFIALTVGVVVWATRNPETVQRIVEKAAPVVEEIVSRLSGGPSTADEAHAFAEPVLAAVAKREPTWGDDFSDPSSGWDVGSTADGGERGYEDDAYYISTACLPQGECCIGAGSSRAPSFSDFVLEVDGRFVSGERGFWSVIFRDSPATPEQPVSAHYGAGFYPDGAFEIWKNVGGTHVELIETNVRAPTFEQGLETNHLTIIARGPQIALYVNGEPLWLVHDESSSSGMISLMVENVTTDTQLRVRFDNLAVWDISDLVLPGETPTPVGRIVYADDRTGDHEIYVAGSDGSGEWKLTDHPADDREPTWSPDGTRIVFTSDRDAVHVDNDQLYVVDADGSKLTRLTYTDRNDSAPSCSPDGNRIAFHSNCGLAVIGADGSNWRLLVEGREDLCVDFPTWSPDSRQIAFRSVTPPAGPPQRHDVYVVNADGSGLSKLATFTSEEWGWYVVWFPDGSRVAFDVWLGGQRRCYAVNSDGSSEPQEITNIPQSWYPNFWPQWSQP